jgi:hypothetical protein
MGHDLLFHALLLLGVLGFGAILRGVWPPRRAAMDQADGQPATRTYRRSADPPPFPGLTTKPLCATCEQAAQAHVAQASAGAPPLMTSTRGRRRQVATQHQFCLCFPKIHIHDMGALASIGSFDAKARE